MEGTGLGKWIIFMGLGLILIGGAIWLFSKWGIPLGRLPGDIHVKGEKGSFYFPIVTSIVVSIVLSILLSLFFRFFRK